MTLSDLARFKSSLVEVRGGYLNLGFRKVVLGLHRHLHPKSNKAPPARSRGPRPLPSETQPATFVKCAAGMDAISFGEATAIILSEWITGLC